MQAKKEEEKFVLGAESTATSFYGCILILIKTKETQNALTIWSKYSHQLGFSNLPSPAAYSYDEGSSILWGRKLHS
jgi:hypothetical protein